MRILIAEDEVEIARALKVLLEKNKCSVDIVHNGKDAWDYISQGKFDVVVLDIMMPEHGTLILHQQQRLPHQNHKMVQILHLHFLCETYPQPPVQKPHSQ